MKGTKIFFTLLIFSIAVAFIGCPAPVGSLKYSLDYIKAVPSKTMYDENNLFIPAQQLKVFGVFGGVEDEIDIDKVAIKIIEDPSFSSQNEIPIADNQRGIKLTKEGYKTVVITYTDKETSYDITVGAPGTGEVGWGDGGTGIVIIW